jgi:hypothetical protein
MLRWFGAPAPGGFWEKPVEAADVITVGLRRRKDEAFGARFDRRGIRARLGVTDIDGTVPLSYRYEMGGPPECI